MWFYALIVIYTLLSIIGVIGNGLVIYVANRSPKQGALCHLNKVVRNLAVTDFLFNILATPLLIAYWTITWSLGKNGLN